MLHLQKGAGSKQVFRSLHNTTDDCTLSHELLDIRRNLAASGDSERDKLHATADLQETRDQVFAALAKHKVRVDATLLEKSKAMPKTRTTDPLFYKYAWYFHLKHVAPGLVNGVDKLLITAAALGTKKTRASFKEAVNNTLQQTVPRDRWEVCFMDSAKDPMLWAADYCAWAIQRKWELGDLRSHEIIKPWIASEYDLWEVGTVHYY